MEISGDVMDADAGLKHECPSRIPSVYLKWVFQGLFYCLSFSTWFWNVICRSDAIISMFSERAGVPYRAALDYAWCLVSGAIIAVVSVLALVLKFRRVSGRTSALGYSLALMLVPFALWDSCFSGILRFSFSAIAACMSFALFLLAFNAANKEFSILFGIFVGRRSVGRLWFRNVLLAVVSFAMCWGIAFATGTYGLPLFLTSRWFCLSCGVVSFAFLANNNFSSRKRMRLFVYNRILERDGNDCRLPAMRKTAYDLFVKHHPPYFIDEVIQSMIRICYHLKVDGEENISLDDLPAVFICNHGEEIGPICGMTFIPTYLNPWVHAEMCRKDLAYARMWRFTFGPRFHENSRFGKFLTRVIASVVTYLIGGVEPLEVHRDNPRKIMKLFMDTKDCLASGGNVLIFPEDPGKSDNNGYYQQGSVGDMFAGFAQIGKIYAAETGMNLHFFPVFINKKRRTLHIGKPIAYDSKAADAREEKMRIVKELQERMNAFV